MSVNALRLVFFERIGVDNNVPFINSGNWYDRVTRIGEHPAVGIQNGCAIIPCLRMNYSQLYSVCSLELL
jgi:hypothetical protein